ncbi:MAG: hypothetical protein AAF253_00665 [Pseudomonadota bacterium]
MATRWAYLTAMTALAALSSQAQTQDAATLPPQPASDGGDEAGETAARTILTPEDFARFSPQTAGDMVSQVPGFSIQGVEQSRGLGQATSNVLINGERPSGKSNDALDALGRIPASRVVRIELVDASTLGIPGLSGRVANVITSGTGISGVWDWNARFRERLEPRYNQADASVTGEQGDISWTVGLELEGNRFGDAGPEFVFDGNDTLIETRNDDFEGSFAFIEGSLALGWKPPNGHEANVSLTYADLNFTRRLRGNRIRTDGDNIFRLFRGGEDEWNSEISGDYALPQFGGTLKLIGYYRHEDSRFNNQAIERELATGDLGDGVRFLQDFIENEAIGRAEFDWSTGPGRDWQLAVENAYNRLDAGSDFLTSAGPEDFVLQDRSTPVLVDETRAEISLTHTRELTEKLSLQASLSGEYSELASEVGMDVSVQDFVRPKGYVSATYEASENFVTTLRVDREVGQLNFFDFVSTRNINDENEEGGNRSIVPDQTWRFELELDRKYGDLGASTITLFHEEIEDLVDRILLPGGLSGAGNLDSARRSGIEIDATLQFDRFGLEGVQLELEADAQVSEVEDPLTGQDRWISQDKVSFVLAELRWDIPDTPYALITGYEQFRDAQVFRIDEISDFNNAPGFGWIEVEHKDFFGLNAFVRLANLYDQRDTQRRLVFEPNRMGTVSQRLEYDRDFGHIFLFGFSGNF